jgi:hypothetical protein
VPPPPVESPAAARGPRADGRTALLRTDSRHCPCRGRLSIEREPARRARVAVRSRPWPRATRQAEPPASPWRWWRGRSPRGHPAPE